MGSKHTFVSANGHELVQRNHFRTVNGNKIEDKTVSAGHKAKNPLLLINFPISVLKNFPVANALKLSFFLHLLMENLSFMKQHVATAKNVFFRKLKRANSGCCAYSS